MCLDHPLTAKLAVSCDEAGRVVATRFGVCDHARLRLEVPFGIGDRITGGAQPPLVGRPAGVGAEQAWLLAVHA
jgi:hypothetical protein